MIEIVGGRAGLRLSNDFSVHLIRRSFPTFCSAYKDFFFVVVNTNIQKWREFRLKYEFLSFPQTWEYLPNLVRSSNVARIHGCRVAAATFRQAMHFAMFPSLQGPAALIYVSNLA